jgi:alpha-tubulin suppressor-like RCC1 family protein
MHRNNWIRLLVIAGSLFALLLVKPGISKAQAEDQAETPIPIDTSALTDTDTIVPTVEPTATDFLTFTQTPTDMPSDTPSPASTTTPTNTETPTITGTNTRTSTRTPTSTRTMTKTRTNTRTPSNTRTITNTPTRNPNLWVAITSPNGGEIWSVGTTHTITWDNSPNIDMITIGYKTCPSCLSWIANNIPNTGSYDWYVSVPPGTQYIIEVIAYDVGVGSIVDLSDAPFTVAGPPTSTPTVTRTKTPTSTRTNTRTSTSTFMPTSTPTNTETSTPTPTATLTPNSALLQNISKIAAGFNHTCAITLTSGLKCWGMNNSAQLGDGTQGTLRYFPVDVIGLQQGVLAVSAGNDHTCAIITDGFIKCWGYNFNGELGNGTFITYPATMEPQLVVGLQGGNTAIGAGSSHTCAITSGGGVKCWGYNNDGQLGDGTTTNSAVPVDVLGITDAVELSVGHFHTCIRTYGGGVKCWGSNYHGELGIGSTVNSSTPVDVTGLSSGVVAIASGGAHTCALLASGSVKCWGWEYWGQLGNGVDTYSETTPVDVIGLTDVVGIYAGALTTCALLSDGSVKCWGYGGYYQLGIGSTDSSNVPVTVVGLSGPVMAVSMGYEHVCALMSTGTVSCWGKNTYRQMGDGTSIDRPFPVDVLVVIP